MDGGSRPLIVAHRGASGVFAENTRAAFLHAAALGSDLIETDLHLTADHHVVCTHAHMLEQPGDGPPVPIHQLTLEQLRSLDFHTWMGAEIPAEYGTSADQFMTLPELLAAVAGLGQDIGLLLEMKEPYPFGRLLEERVLEDLTAVGWSAEDSHVPGADGATIGISFISFDPESIQYLVDAGVPKELLMAVVSPRRADNAKLIDAGLVGVAAPKWDWVHESEENAAKVREWKTRGLQLNIWTLNDESGVLESLDYDVDFITTDFPDIAISTLGQAVTT